MMFSDEEIKESSLRPGDEIISIHELFLDKKIYYGKKYLEPQIPNCSKSELEVPRLVRDGFFPDGAGAKFAWTEEDGNIASLVPEPGFGTTGQTSFGRDLDAVLKKEEANTMTVIESKYGLVFERKSEEPGIVSSTSSEGASSSTNTSTQSKGRAASKVDKTDPRSKFHYVKIIKRHGRTVKLFECGICGREFRQQYTLMRHLPTHTDERNFHCDSCPKSFRQLSTLSQHRAIHSAERPYACEVCSKTFNRVSTLISHRKTHSDEKPYKCHICLKGFHQKGNLRNHLFTHTNERPYRCDICLKGFNQQSNLVCHKNKAHLVENGTSTTVGRNRTAPRDAPPVTPKTKTVPPRRTNTSTSRAQSEQCEVTSSVGPYLPLTTEPPYNQQQQWEMKLEQGDAWEETSWGNNGVIVDPINTYHMGVALATRQIPFAMLKSESGVPVLVKVVDTKLPGGKQMLVPATVEDLRVGGKIILGREENSNQSQEIDIQSAPDSDPVLKIRVPVVATVVPKMQPGGRLQFSIEEPHRNYHAAMASDGSVQPKADPFCSKEISTATAAAPRLEPLQCVEASGFDDHWRPGLCSSPPAPSPPLDLIALDLFETMGCIPLGPQITAVDIDESPPSDDSDIFIGKFEGHLLSNSD